MTEGLTLIDVHAHLQDEKFSSDLDQVINNALQAGVKRIVNVGTCLESTRQALDIAEKFTGCFAVAGIHPHDASTFNKDSLAELRELSNHPKVVAIGEIGLDFHYDFSPRKTQEEVFAQLWQLAYELQMPAVIHIREAFERFFPLIDELPTPPKVLLHCFSGDAEIARRAVERDFHFSIGGPLTFAKGEQTRQIFAQLPLHLIHLETDCPYLAPVPKRGKRNEPANLRHILQRLAEVRRLDKGILATQLANNAQSFFGDKLR
jgi:TatD DNase family protein